MIGSKIKVIVDSTCDLPEELVKEYDIDIVPVYILHEGKSLADREEITSTEFYDILRNVEELPKTSAPNPKDFMDKIQKNIKDFSTIVIATLSSKLSATYQSARIIINRIKDTKIHLIDSKFGSGVLAFITLAIAKLSRQGLNDDEIIEKVTQLRDESILLGYVDNIENFKKSGRISHLKYFLATLLRAKPILELKDGVLEPAGKATSKEKAQQKVVEEILLRIKKDTKYDIMITHGDDREAAEKLMKELESKIPLGEKIINFLTPALAVHLGIGTVVVSLSPSI